MPRLGGFVITPQEFSRSKLAVEGYAIDERVRIHRDFSVMGDFQIEPYISIRLAMEEAWSTIPFLR
jgi:hypothetical protein